MTENANEMYGALREGVHIAGYSFERACTKLEALLENGRWRSVGDGFDDVNAFLASIRLDQFRASLVQRKYLVRRIKELQPTASQRRIAEVVGVSEATSAYPKPLSVATWARGLLLRQMTHLPSRT